MTVVHSLLLELCTCWVCTGSGEIPEAWMKGEQEYRNSRKIICPHCEGTGTYLEKDGV